MPLLGHDEVSLTPEEEEFCCQYAGFVVASPSISSRADLAQRYIAGHPKQDYHDYPDLWLTDDAERRVAAEKFLKLTQKLWPEMSPARQKIPFWSFKRFVYFAIVGAVSQQVASYLLSTPVREVRNRSEATVTCTEYNDGASCESWVMYNADRATPAQDDYLTRFSKECSQEGGSADFQRETQDGGLLFRCVHLSMA